MRTSTLILAFFISVLSVADAEPQSKVSTQEGTIVKPAEVGDNLIRPGSHLVEICKNEALRGIKDTKVSAVCEEYVAEIFKSDLELTKEYIAIYLDDKKNLTAHTNELNKMAINSLESQRKFGKILFFFSILAFILGVIVSCVNFITAIKNPNSGLELKIVGREFYIKTNWIGLFTLIVSMIFMLLIANIIYPITYLN